MKLPRLFKTPHSRKASVESIQEPPKDWHALFRDMRFMGTQITRGGSWSARAQMGNDADGDPHLIDVIIFADEVGPTHGQSVFYQQLIHNPEELFDPVRHRVVPAWEIRMGKKFPEDWQSELTLSALRVPRFGDRNRSWAITFSLASALGTRVIIDLKNGIAVDLAFERRGKMERSIAVSPGGIRVQTRRRKRTTKNNEFR